MSPKHKSKATTVKTKSKGSKSKTKSKATALELRAITEKQTKVQILKAISEETGLSAKEVRAVFATASHLVKCHLIKRGSGEFSIPEMAIKVVRKSKPATKQREGINPFTGDAIKIPAKPKRDVVKVKPLKSLKEVVA